MFKTVVLQSFGRAGERERERERRLPDGLKDVLLGEWK